MSRINSNSEWNYADVFRSFGYEHKLVAAGSEALLEACPWCQNDKFYVEVSTGRYHCKHCEASGNHVTFLTDMYKSYLKKTTDRHYQTLGALRGIAYQTLRLHGLAYSEERGQWIIPFKNGNGNVEFIQFYRPSDGAKYNVSLPIALYGFDKLVAAKDKNPKPDVYLCEAPISAIAIDAAIGAKHRSRHVCLATAGAHFKESWAKHFEGFDVRIMPDNDEAGIKYAETAERLLDGTASSVWSLHWPSGTPAKYDPADFHKDRPDDSIISFFRDNCYKSRKGGGLVWHHGWERRPGQIEIIDWVWPNRMRCGTYVSLSGFRGTMKSTIIREIVALYTKGLPMPGCDGIGMPAGHVIYVTAEDSVDKVWTDLERFGAEARFVSVLSPLDTDNEQINFIDRAGELARAIARHGTRFVIIDGQNSVVGKPNITTDMMARQNISNRLHHFAQRENVCLVGIRNDDPTGRAYGPASMSDMARCILRSEAVREYRGKRYFKLLFERVTDAAPATHPPLPFSVVDLGGDHRRISWNDSPPRAVVLADELVKGAKGRKRGRGER